jgi:hypothetical protein
VSINSEEVQPRDITVTDIEECTVRPMPTMAAPVIMAAGIVVGVTTSEVQREGNHPLPVTFELRHRAPGATRPPPSRRPRRGGVFAARNGNNSQIMAILAAPPKPCTRTNVVYQLMALPLQKVRDAADCPPRRETAALVRARRRIQKLSPYQSLALLLVPVVLVEPLKLVALFVAGEGHWLTGTGMIIGAYAFSLLVVERLFRAVKPKLMTLSWFAKLWTRLVALRNKVIPWSSVPVEGIKTG